MTPIAMFSVALIKNANPDDDKLVDEYTYVATCDRCGKELPEVALPITIINLKGKVPPGQVDAFKKAWRAAVARSLEQPSHRQQLIMNADVEILKVESGLGDALIEHAQKCPALNRSEPTVVGRSE